MLLAAALLHNPDLLVLDEPFSGLDPIGIATMTDVVREQASKGAGVVFSTTGGNSITLYRNTAPGYAPIVVCAAPTGDQTQRYCTVVQNNLVAAKQSGVQVFLNNPNNPGAGLGQIIASAREYRAGAERAHRRRWSRTPSGYWRLRQHRAPDRVTKDPHRDRRASVDVRLPAVSFPRSWSVTCEVMGRRARRSRRLPPREWSGGVRRLLPKYRRPHPMRRWKSVATPPCWV